MESYWNVRWFLCEVHICMFLYIVCIYIHTEQVYPSMAIHWYLATFAKHLAKIQNPKMWTLLTCSTSFNQHSTTETKNHLSNLPLRWKEVILGVKPRASQSLFCQVTALDPVVPRQHRQHRWQHRYSGGWICLNISGLNKSLGWFLQLYPNFHVILEGLCGVPKF